MIERTDIVSTGRFAALAIGIVVVAISASSAIAQLGAVNFQFQDSEGPANATIIVPVQIVSLSGASTVFFRLEFDDQSLVLTDVFPGASTTAAGKEVSVGVDEQSRPTVLVTDFGGGTDIILNGDLVFLIFRSAAGLGVGTDVVVSGSDASAATPAGEMLTAAVFGATVGIVACTIPSRPSFLAASDGTLADRVALGWLPVAGASEYHILRNTSNNFGSAEVLATVEETQYDDLSATAATLIMGGCQGQTLPQFEAFFYWVVAANACGNSPPSPVDSGFRGLAMASARDEHGLRLASAAPFLWLASVAGFASFRRRRPSA